MTYAKGTDVTVARSQQEVASLLVRYKVEVYAFGVEVGKASVAFELGGTPIRVGIPLPLRPATKTIRNPATGRMVDAVSRWEQEVKEAWRALVLLLKANLEAVERGIVTPEQAFMAYLVTADGRTVGEVVLPQYIEHRAQLALTT